MNLGIPDRPATLPIRTWVVRIVLPIAIFSLNEPAAGAIGVPQNRVSLTPREKWETFFGGQECVYHFEVTAPGVVRANAGWSLSHTGRTIVRREFAFQAGPGADNLLEVRLSLPRVKEGVMWPVQLAVSLYSEEDGKTLATWEKTLYIFGSDPFAGKSEWLKTLKIGLFDPQGETRKALDELKVPYGMQNSVEGLSQFEGQLLMIGSGLDFSQRPGLWEALLEVCGRRIQVLVLAPNGGTAEIPGTEGCKLPELAGMRLLKRDIIRELDSKLDMEAWPPDGKVITSSMTLRTSRAGVVGEFTAGDRGWPWLELDIRDGGKMIVCGFAIVERLDGAPTARYLLARLLEYLACEIEPAKEEGGAR